MAPYVRQSISILSVRDMPVAGTFIVVLEEPLSKKAEDKLLATLGANILKLSPTLFLVAGGYMTADLAKKFGVYDSEGAGAKEGLVLELGHSRAGFHDSSTWEWFARLDLMALRDQG